MRQVFNPSPMSLPYSDTDRMILIELHLFPRVMFCSFYFVKYLRNKALVI